MNLKHGLSKLLANSTLVLFALGVFPAFAYADEGRSFDTGAWIQVIGALVIIALGFYAMNKHRKQKNEGHGSAKRAGILESTGEDTEKPKESGQATLAELNQAKLIEADQDEPSNN